MEHMTCCQTKLCLLTITYSSRQAIRLSPDPPVAIYGSSHQGNTIAAIPTGNIAIP